MDIFFVIGNVWKSVKIILWLYLNDFKVFFLFKFIKMFLFLEEKWNIEIELNVLICKNIVR